MSGGPSWSPRPATATTRSACAGRVEHADRPTGEVRHGLRPTGSRTGCCSRRAAPAGSRAARRVRPPTGPTPTSSWPPGCKGGKGVPETVAAHPRLFVTFTAPSFGRVHTRKAQGRLVLPCHPYRQGARCPHGRRDGCWHRHDEDDPRLGEPLCPACYDAEAQVLWNALAARAVAADHHRRPACPGPAGRPPGGRAAAAGPDLLCQGGRVPAARGDPLPRRHPPGRRHRLPLPWLPGPTTRAVHRRPARGRPAAGGPGRPGALPARRRGGPDPVCPLG